MNYADTEMVDCYGFEQLVENDIKTKAIIKLMCKLAETEKSVKGNEWLSNDDVMAALGYKQRKDRLLLNDEE